MARSKKEAGQAYIEGILKHIPEAEREAIKKSLTAEAVLEAAGEGVLLRDDYSRAMDEAQSNQQKVVEYFNSLQAWYGENQQKIAGYDDAVAKLEAATKGNPAPAAGGPPAFDPAKYISREDAAKLLAQSQNQLAGDVSGYLAFLTNIGMKHYHEYGEPIDLMALDQRARKENKRVDVLYDELTKDKREAKLAEAAKKHDEEIRKAERERLEEEFRKRTPQMPYPMGQEAADPLGNATLTGLGTTPEKPQFGAQAALDEFYRMRRTS